MLTNTHSSYANMWLTVLGRCVGSTLLTQAVNLRRIKLPARESEPQSALDLVPPLTLHPATSCIASSWFASISSSSTVQICPYHIRHPHPPPATEPSSLPAPPQRL
ncbi:hypothetical protein QCA50_005335 [Cerrena zonata]|uniref:Uncharacterized protein n=1 Tax=Cerrena zonata TaxID=2478898 RepID=A0AAW0GRP2_9APHY